jgi:hypothetical protein
MQETISLGINGDQIAPTRDLQSAQIPYGAFGLTGRGAKGGKIMGTQ